MLSLNFTDELLGGLLIGIASVLPLVFKGRIAGVSGYAASALRPHALAGRESLAFVLGLIISGLVLLRWLAPASVPAFPVHSLSYFAVAGLLVGYGARVAGGCTSGHGVCGLGRFSVRSLVSVIIFMTVAMVVVWLRGLVS